MASEPTERAAPVTVRLPADLDEWLDEEAAELGVDRESLLVQMLASYRATSALDGELDAVVEFEEWPEDEQLRAAVDDHLEETVTDRIEDGFEDRVAETVQSVLADQLDDRIDDRVEAALAEAVAGQVSEATEAVRADLEERIESARSEFQGKLEDVRERVIQVKQEADAKAPADHDHEEFERFLALERRLDEIDERVDGTRERLDAALPEQETAVEELEEELSTVQERLQTVAWAVSDLRDAVESGDGMAAVDRIKRAAAKADVDRARCENCKSGVEIGLLTEPNCPHCDATVTDVEPSSGFFDKPRLLVASQLESGAEE